MFFFGKGVIFMIFRKILEVPVKMKKVKNNLKLKKNCKVEACECQKYE